MEGLPRSDDARAFEGSHAGSRDLSERWEGACLLTLVEYAVTVRECPGCWDSSNETWLLLQIEQRLRVQIHITYP